jgi:hypothetical protein
MPIGNPYVFKFQFSLTYLLIRSSSKGKKLPKGEMR